jgi:hypothetical protein
VGIDLLALKGYSVVYLAFIPIIKIFVCLSAISGKFRLFAKFAGKTAYFNLTTDKEDERSVAKYVDNKYKPTLDITNANVSIKVGKKGDAMISALLYAFSERLFILGMKYIDDTQKVKLRYTGQIVDKNALEFYAVISVNLSLAMVLKELIGFFIGKIKADIRNKKIKKEKNQNDNGAKRQIFRANDGKLV